jgi:predicted phage gp36 major capsid-like protein
MSDLLERLKAGKSAVAKVTISGVDFGLRVLSEQDYLEAGMAAEAAMKAAGVELSVATAELFETEKSSQLLLRALVNPADNKAVATTAKELRAALSREEVAYLIEQYLSHEKTISPSERNLSDDDLMALLEEVKKTPQTLRLNDLSFAMLKRLITISVSQPAS